MILFKPEHVEMILSGRKTQTRRTWANARVRVGAIHQARTAMFGEPFAHLRITGLRRERLSAISADDCRREGYADKAAYMDVFERIYGTWTPDAEVWVVEFVLADA